MHYSVYDVFCGKHASGNPCGVVVLDKWRTTPELLEMSANINQPVTAFVVPQSSHYVIRWFTTDREINLCAHGTLGAAAALITQNEAPAVHLTSEYGDITVTKQDKGYQMQFPAWSGTLAEEDLLLNWPKKNLVEAYTTRDLVLVLDSEQAVIDFKPDVNWLRDNLQFHALIITAQSGEHEYVLRYFAPSIGINEDAATGSAQCSLAPYWFRKLGMKNLTVRQLSSAGGEFTVSHLDSERLLLTAQSELCFSNSLQLCSES